MDVFRRQKFNEAMFAKNRTLAIRVGQYQSRDINEASFDYGYIKGDTYKPGGTCAGSAKIVFASVITSFSKLDKIYPEIGLLVDGTYEWVKMGEYFINDIEIDRNRKTTKLDLMDGMFKLNREHVTDLTYPAEIRNVIKEICLKTGVELANENMGIASMNYRIDKIPKDKKMTFRDVLGQSAQMLGMSCFFNREGKLEVKELTDSGITITADSYFMHGLTKSEIEYQIAGITCKKDKETLTVGLRTGRSLEIENVLMYQSALDNLYHSIKDIRYYPYSLNYQGHLLLDVGQWVTIKTNTGETFKSPVLSQSFNFKGGLRGRISADSKAGNDAQYSYAGTITKKIEQFNEFEAQLQNQIEEADRGFDAKVDQIKQDFSDQIKLVEAKAEENKRSLSEEINRRFQDFNSAGFEETKAKAEEALKKAGTSAEVISEIKEVIRGNSIDLINISSRVNEQDGKITDFKNEYGSKMLEVNQTTDGIKTKIGEITSFIDKDGQRQEELKRYAREETASKTNAIRETISRDYVAKSTFTETVESTNQRFEALKRDNEVKLADYKQGIDGRITTLASQMAGKVNDADFQRVKETSQLYERVLGNTEQGLPDKISRLVMTNEIFQTEVNDLVVSDNNLIVNSEKLDKHTIVNKRSGVSIYNTDYGVFNIDAQGLTSYNWGGFTLPIYVPKILKDEVYTLGFKYKIRRQLDHEFCVVIKNHSRNKTVLQKTIANPETPVRNVWIDFQGTFKMTEDLDFDQVGSFPIYFYLVKNGWIEVKEPMLVRGPRTGSFKPSQFDEAYKMTDEAKGLATDAQTRAIQIAKGLEATRTQVTQLAGSWAVQNLNSAGDIISGINLGANGNNRIIGRATHITGDTLIDNAVIKSAMVDKLKTANFEAGSVTTNILEAEAVTADKVKFDTAFIQKLVSKQAFIDELFAKQATITRIQSIDFTANHIKGGMLTSTNGRSVFDLNSGQIRMQSGSTGWRTSWDSNGLAFRGPGNDVWGAMGGDSGGGVGIYMRGDHAFNLVVNHNDDGKSQPYTPLRVKYGDGTYLQFSPGGPSYNLLTLFKTIFDNFKYNNSTYYDIR
jgi:pblB